MRTPLLRIVSIARSGRITEHWQCTDVATARRLAAGVAAQLARDDLREKVRIRGVYEVTRRIEFELDETGELPELGPEVFYGQVGC